jgi:hypothetical protein
MRPAIAAQHASGLIADPVAFFDSSFTAMHSLPRERLGELQRSAIALRFSQLRPLVPMLDRLADRQGIDALETVDAAVPLLFEHTMYRSYPAALLEQGRFDQLTRWLDRLTAVDLSGVDADGCGSIDAWLDTLVAQAGLDPAFYPAGDSGSLTFFPWSLRDLRLRDRVRRTTELQWFGEPPSEAALDGEFDYVASVNRQRTEQMAGALGGRAFWRDPSGYSADLLWLSTRLRLAAVKGDASRVAVPEALLARRDELRRNDERKSADEAAWLAEVERLRGRHVLWSVSPGDAIAVAAPRVARGERWPFALGSAMTMAGPTAGLPDDWSSTLDAFTDLRRRRSYAMVELTGGALECTAGRYHLQPWIVPFVLDHETSAALPRTGVQRGRAAFLDLAAESHWGGVITGDAVELDFDGGCACGATTPHIADGIERLSAQRGGDDKITCAAAPEAHAEAMRFLVGY